MKIIIRERDEQHQLRFPNHLNFLSWVAVTHENDRIEIKKPIERTTKATNNIIKAAGM